MMHSFKIGMALCGVGLLASACSFNFLNPRVDPFYAVVLEKDANQPFALYAQGQMLLDQGHFAEAYPYFRRLTKVDKNHAGGWLRLGKCALEMQNYGQAENAYQRALTLNASPEAHLGKALANLMQGDVSSAKKEADQLRTQLEDSPQLMNLYGDIAIVEGQPDQALEFYRKSTEIDASQESIQNRIRDLESFLANR